MATNSEAALIGADVLKVGAVVCDVARPANVARDVVENLDDVLVFEGGLVELPEPIHFGPNLLGFRPGILLGCLAETVLLALEGDNRDHSIGHKLDPAEAEYLRALAERHGFRAASPHCFGGELSEDASRQRARMKHWRKSAMHCAKQAARCCSGEMRRTLRSTCLPR